MGRKFGTKDFTKKMYAVVYYFQCVQFKINQMETILGLLYMHIIVVVHLPAISEYEKGRHLTAARC